LDESLSAAPLTIGRILLAVAPTAHLVAARHARAKPAGITE
jgi:hypothetical protein